MGVLVRPNRIAECTLRFLIYKDYLVQNAELLELKERVKSSGY
jgi:hypothetical protein